MKNFYFQTFSVSWKRAVFMKFVDMYNHESEKLKYEFQAKLLQWIIIPCVRVSFERGETDTLIGTAPNPDLGKFFSLALDVFI